MKKYKKTQKESPQKRIKYLEKQLEDNLNTIKRLQADFENYIKRSEKEKENLKHLANYELFLDLIKIVDNFEEAMKSLKNSKDKEITNGITMIYNQLINLLQRNNIKTIETIGKKFNPHEHEAIKNQESDKEEGMILKEIQKGYLFHNNVLRPSKVIVSNRNKAEVTKSNNVTMEANQK